MDVKVLRATNRPQQLIWQAMHQCYSTGDVASNKGKYSETEYGCLVVKHLLAGGRGHWSPLEQAHMSLNLTGVPLPIVVQFERHRLFSYSEQSLRYTSLKGKHIEEIVYTRPLGEYKNRNGKNYRVDDELRQARLDFISSALDFYWYQISIGVSEEDARFTLPLGVRKNLVMGGNLRAWLHLMDMRLKKDAQLEAVQLATLIYERLWEWVPEIMKYYDSSSHKKILAP